MPDFYDGAKLLSLTDIEGNKPEIFMCTANNTAGKTTYFSRLCVNRWRDSGSKFMLIYRFTYELDDCADKFFKDLQGLFFPNFNMTSKRKSNGIYHELFINNRPCGYAVAMNSIDQLKKMSHLFSDTDRMFMDEFQSQANHYCPDEVTKFRALHTIVARGQNKQVRYVPVYMCANPITILNPYYTALGISSRLRKETKFIKGVGWVLEQGYNDSASKALSGSAFTRAFGNDAYNSYQTQAVYLDDNMCFIEKPEGKSRYICTLKCGGSSYAVREYYDEGLLYCDDNIDATFPTKLAVTTSDQQINHLMLRTNSMLLLNLRYYFDHACFRFKNLQCKDAIIKALGMY